MRLLCNARRVTSLLTCGTVLALLSTSSVRAQDDKTNPKPAEPTQVDLLDGMRSGQLAATAKSTDDGRLTISVTNRSSKNLRVVLPTSLIASGASGQFGGGGMGGMGGGMMGGMGGGGMGGGMMGGMGGGMGGMGGGMGGMGGGMGGMGGGMGGGMMGGGGGGGTMPPMMGMMMLSNLIMSLTGDKDSWDWNSFRQGMGGGMMGGGMGGGMMGGGMGGRGGGMGGMGGGGGFRSLPVSGAPTAVIKPGQTRHLPTHVVSLSGPTEVGTPSLPAKDDTFELGDLRDMTKDPRVVNAVTRMSQEKTPETVAQLVLWNVISGMDWDTIAGLSHSWANSYELSLARRFVARLDESGGAANKDQAGTLYIEVKSKESTELAMALKDQLTKAGMLGLVIKADIPTRPNGPALACRLTLTGSDEVQAQILASDSQGANWISSGKFTVASESKQDSTEKRAITMADSIAEQLLSRLVRVQLTHGTRTSNGKLAYKVRIDNVSPLVLHGIALTGTTTAPEVEPSALSGFSLPPRKSLTLPATADMVQRLGLKEGVKTVAAELNPL